MSFIKKIEVLKQKRFGFAAIGPRSAERRKGFGSVTPKPAMLASVARTTPAILSIAVNEIVVRGDRRPCDPDAVRELANSIKAIGLKTPITIRRVRRTGWGAGFDLVLVAGRHRLEAVKSLGGTHIDCITMVGDKIDALLWQKLENLARLNLTVLERAEEVAGWLKILETRKKNDSGQNVRNPFGGRPKGGIAQAARDLPIPGKTDEAKRKSVERLMKVASLSKEAKQAAKAAGRHDNEKALLAAAKHSTAEAQVAAVQGNAAPRRIPPRRTGFGRAKPTFAQLKADWIKAGRLKRSEWERAAHDDCGRFMDEVLRRPNPKKGQARFGSH